MCRSAEHGGRRCDGKHLSLDDHRNRAERRRERNALLKRAANVEKRRAAALIRDEGDYPITAAEVVNNLLGDLPLQGGATERGRREQANGFRENYRNQLLPKLITAAQTGDWDSVDAVLSYSVRAACMIPGMGAPDFKRRFTEQHTKPLRELQALYRPLDDAREIADQIDNGQTPDTSLFYQHLRGSMHIAEPEVEIPPLYTENQAAEAQAAALLPNYGEACDRAMDRIDANKLWSGNITPRRREVLEQMRYQYAQGLVDGNFEPLRSHPARVVTKAEREGLIACADQDRANTLPRIISRQQSAGLDTEYLGRVHAARERLARIERDGIEKVIADNPGYVIGGADDDMQDDLKMVNNYRAAETNAAEPTRRLLDATNSYPTITRLNERGVPIPLAKRMAVAAAVSGKPVDIDTAVDTYESTRDMPAELANSLYGAAVFTDHER